MERVSQEEEDEGRNDTAYLLLKAAIFGVIATNISLLISQGGVSLSYLVRGFPFPFLAFNGCEFYLCMFDGSPLHPIPSFFFSYALADFAIWFGITLGILFMIPLMNTRKRSGMLAGVSLASGLGVCLLTFFVHPLSMYSPIVGLESRIDYIGGFPLAFFQRVSSFLPITHPTLYSFFTPTNFVIDFILWSLVSAAVIGFILKIATRRPMISYIFWPSS